MAKIAIISCNNVKNELSCAASGCFKAFNERNGMFADYDKEAKLVGFSTCAGCPTLYAFEKILSKIKPLIEISKADTIHFSSCMVKLCPFVQKYKNAINTAYPNVEVVMGTDEATSLEQMKIMLRNLLINARPDICQELKKINP